MEIKKHIPNTITLLNLVSGICAVIMALWGHYLSSFFFIIASAVFDFLDGFTARLLNSYSEIGKELDSLADDISFGLTPAMMLFNWYYNDGHTVTAFAYIPFIIAAFSALRLAKFNLDKRQDINFRGLATPLCAIFVGALVSYGHLCRVLGAFTTIRLMLGSDWFIPVLSIVLSLLLICDIPMFSLKHKKFGFDSKENLQFSLFMMSIPVWIGVAYMFRHPRLPFFSPLLIAVLLISVFYLIINFCFLNNSKSNL